MPKFIGIMVSESYGDAPYEILKRVEDIIDVSDRYITYRCGDDGTIDSMILGESLDSVIKKLTAAGVPVFR